MRYRIELRCVGVTLRSLDTNSLDEARETYKVWDQVPNSVTLLFVNGICQHLLKAPQLLKIQKRPDEGPAGGKYDLSALPADFCFDWNRRRCFGQAHRYCRGE